MLIVGNGFTVTVTCEVEEQPACVTVRVYVVVTVGVATGFETVLLLKLDEGVQAYVPPPDPLSVVLPPWQMEALAPALAAGDGFTVTQTTFDVTVPHPVTTAWKQVLEFKAPVVYGVVVAPAILVHGPVDVGPDCH